VSLRILALLRDCLFEFFDNQVMDETFANDNAWQPAPAPPPYIRSALASMHRLSFAEV
jgi:hypothetical protein